jgi:hypothetical protein
VMLQHRVAKIARSEPIRLLIPAAIIEGQFTIFSV